MSRLCLLLDKLEGTPLPNMTFASVRDIAREVVAAGTSGPAIEQELTTLSSTQQDTLMKVLYCCLKNDCKSSATYFRWHAKLYAIAGSGSIIRVMTEKPL
ncbi:ARP2/3 complex subunit [Trypanosoma grayi]|uniref:ARP2/3 complex subunit n=1 Tax=Trypanosoma grayi TaxID=71804 RepID=UPI0004F449B7|nr:ARP2/3 complex subunit [Trypanosoma grayi]KEG14004.1 ARP2/3 complex subunit [Trypanosoma grayi]